jgi:phosphoribosylaminoimidazole-succinocarboxamide synthase
VINNRISEYIMTKLNSIGVQNHFIKRLNLREQLIKESRSSRWRWSAATSPAGSLSTRYGLPEGQPLPARSSSST